MRRGELLGLDWDDLDFKNQMVSIDKSLQYVAGKGVFTKCPKTKASVRTIKLSTKIFQILSEYKLWQKGQKLKSEDKWKESRFVFTAVDGNPSLA